MFSRLLAYNTLQVYMTKLVSPNVSLSVKLVHVDELCMQMYQPRKSSTKGKAVLRFLSKEQWTYGSIYIKLSTFDYFYEKNTQN